MKILAMDTCLAACSVAVRTDGELLAHRFEYLERGHAEALMPMVEAARAQAGISYGDLDLVAVTIGPGTFTGVRVGVAAARGLALVERLPVVGVTSLHALAYGALAAGAARPDEWVVAAIDARRAQVYLQSFAPGLVPSGDPTLLPIAAAAAALPHGRGVVVGTGGALLADRLGAAGSRLRIFAAPQHPDAAVVAAIAEELSGADPVGAGAPSPLYVRTPAARLP